MFCGLKVQCREASVTTINRERERERGRRGEREGGK